MVWLGNPLTCAIDSFKQKVQELLVNILADVDLWG